MLLEDIINNKFDLCDQFDELRMAHYQYLENHSEENILRYVKCLEESGDREYALLVLEKHLSRFLMSASYLTKVVKVYLDFYLNDDAYNLLLKISNVTELSKCYESLCLEYITRTSFYFNCEKIQYLLSNIADLSRFAHVQLIFEEFLKLKQEVQCKEKLFFDSINDLYLKKENKRAAQLLFVKYELGDRSVELFHHLSGNLRLELPANFSYFRMKGYYYYSSVAERFYGYVSFLVKQYRLREAYKCLLYDLRIILLQKDQSVHWRKNLYYLYIRVNNLLNIKKLDTLLNIEEARITGLNEPMLLEKKFLENNNIKNDYHNCLSISVGLFIVGQIRGKLSQEYLDKFSFVNKMNLYTWDQAAVSSVRFSSLEQIFSVNCLRKLPKNFHSLQLFKEKFPQTLFKIEHDIELFKNNTQSIVHNMSFDKVYIEEEGRFNQLYNNHQGLLVNGKLNQSKMYYLNYVSLVQDYSNLTDIDIIIKMRPDFIFDVDIQTLWKYIQDCNANRNLIYVPYITSNGYGDQFAIGHKSVMRKYGEIWRRCIIAGRLKYSSLFEDFSNNGAESLLANHLIMEGIDVQHIYLRDRQLLKPMLPTQLVDYYSIFEQEYTLLSDIDKNHFQAFFLEIQRNNKI